MERKLVKQGRNALTVTLPSEWIKNNGLKQGDIVHVKQENQELSISTQRHSQKTSITIDLKNAKNSMFFHTVLGAYIDGYDRIEVIHNNPKIVQRAVNSMIGMMIEELTENRAVYKTIVSVPEDNFNALIRRSGYILSELGKSLDIIVKRKMTVEEFIRKEQILDNNLRYCMRFLHKYERSSFKKFLLCAELELAGDELKKVATFIGNDKRLAETVKEGIDHYVKYFFAGELKRLYTTLREFRNKIPNKTFAQGIAYSLAETLYNDIGYLIERKEQR